MVKVNAIMGQKDDSSKTKGSSSFDEEDLHGEPSDMSMHDNSVREKIGGKETTMVNLSKIVVFVSICILAVLIGFITKSFLESQEKREYQTQVRRHATSK